MKTFFLFATIALFTYSNQASAAAAGECPYPWHCEMLPYVNQHVPFSQVTFRAGYLEESKDATVPFLGNILYFEGLGDSMVNHYPLFKKLTDAGYRVLAFDYQGQGGSTGFMDSTRIKEIPEMGEIVWKTPGFAKDLDHHAEKYIIGWSTGGLAAYYAAHEYKKYNVAKVVLIAPGIYANKEVGEQFPEELRFNQITLKTLTTAWNYGPNDDNPHLDEIKPKSPLEVPFFAADLLLTAAESHIWEIDPAVSGYVLLSGKKDTYVNGKKTKSKIDENASSFRAKTYDGALHEIDNEVPAIAVTARNDILDFFSNTKAFLNLIPRGHKKLGFFHNLFHHS